MSFDWTNPSTWTFQPGECVEFAEAVLRYVSNSAEKYPSAGHNLATLRERAEQLRMLEAMSNAEFDRFRSQVFKERQTEGTGFSILADYLMKLSKSPSNRES